MSEILLSKLLETHKECALCKIYKLRSEFTPVKKNLDGLSYSCRPCCNIKNLNNKKKRFQDPEKYKKHLTKGQDYMQTRRSDPSFIEKPNKQSLKKYRSENPERILMYARIGYHVKKGTIVPDPCAICGSTKVEAHHENYEKQYDIIWLCRKHHREIHRKFSEARAKLGLPEQLPE